MFKFVALVLGLLGQNIVLADVAAQVPYQYGANFNHAFADPRQDVLSDPAFVTSALVGGANAVYTTLGLLTVNSRVTNNCNKINEMLNVADLATQTVAVGDASTNAGLTSTQTAITAIVNKINEIIQKGTLTC